MNKRTHFISDLHLFCDRSVAKQHFSSFHAAAGKSCHFVLGGDIFDLKWSRLGSTSETLSAAQKWVTDFVRPFPNCQFHYLLGNHDCAPPLVEKLDEVSASIANLKIHPYVLRIDNRVFLHGDVADRLTDQQQLEFNRHRRPYEESKGGLANTAYNTVVGMKLHRLATHWYPPHRVAERILHYLDSIGEGKASGISDVYFGHTHCHLSDYEFNGVRFHNGGAPIKGLKFKIVEVSPRQDIG
jgi:UDP-2,3-diacylglucosamine pyrophosphatase LpxH